MPRFNSRFGFTVVSILFWTMALLVMLNQWFHQRAESMDVVANPDLHRSSIAAARQVWVGFFLFCMGYVAVSAAYVGIVWIAMRRRFPVSTQWKVVRAAESQGYLEPGY